MALEWAIYLKSNPSMEALEINEANIMELLEEIRGLKKEVRKLERDKDVLYFDLANWKPEDPAPKRGKCPLDIED
jgi:hypothetical protein